MVRCYIIVRITNELCHYSPCVEPYKTYIAKHPPSRYEQCVFNAPDPAAASVTIAEVSPVSRPTTGMKGKKKGKKK